MSSRKVKAKIFSQAQTNGFTSSEDTAPTVMYANNPGKQVAISATHGTS
jgi:hypothetical protein